MESTFERIDLCILGFFNNAIQPATYTLADCAVFQHELKESYLALRKSVIAFVFTADDNRKVEYRIQQIQRQFVQLANYVDNFQSSEKSIKKKSSYYKDACHAATRQVEEVLTFLEQNFPHYLNMHENVPAGYKRLLQSEMKQRVVQVKEFLTTLELTDEYVQLIMQPAEEFLQANDRKTFTYHDKWYLKHMYEELIEAFETPVSESSFNKMTKFLVSINFNSPFFLEYFTKSIALSVTNADNFAAQIEKLSWWEKEIAHLYQSVATPYRPQIPGAKESLEAWVRNETKHLEKLHQLALIMPPQHEAVMPPATFSTSLSVPELACLFRVLADNKIFHHEKQQEMITFFARHFKTKMTDGISPNSFKNNYYDVTPKTAKNVRGILIELINTTRSFE